MKISRSTRIALLVAVVGGLIVGCRNLQETADPRDQGKQQPKTKIVGEDSGIVKTPEQLAAADPRAATPNAPQPATQPTADNALPDTPTNRLAALRAIGTGPEAVRIRGPRNWRPGIVPGVEFGLRVPAEPIVLGGPIPVEIHVRNVGKEPVEIPMRSRGSDEPYPAVQFRIGAAATSLIQPGGVAAEGQAPPRKRTLRPNESLVYSAALETWVVSGDEARKGVQVFDRPAVYWIECIWQNPGTPPRSAAARLEFVRPGAAPPTGVAPDARRLARSDGSVPECPRMPDYEVTYENLALMLQSGDYRERYSAAEHLSRTSIHGWKGTKEQADQLVVTALKDPFWAVRYEAAKFASTRGRLAAGVVPALVEALASEEPLVRKQCVLALGRAGGVRAALPRLKQMLAAGDQLDAVVAVLLDSPAQGLALLKGTADSSDARVRLWSRAALAKGGADAAPYMKELTAALETGGKDAVIDACRSVEFAGKVAGPAGTKLGKLLSAADLSIRLAASRGLAASAPQEQAAVDALVAALGDKDIQHNCLPALGHIGPKAASAIPALLDLMERDGSAAYGAMLALERIDPRSPRALPVLIRVLQKSLEKERSPNEQAIVAIGAYGPAAKAAVPDLIRVLHVKGSHPYYVDKAIWALGQIGPDAIEARQEVRSFIPGFFAETARQALRRIEAKDPAAMPPPEPRYTGRTLGGLF